MAPFETSWQRRRKELERQMRQKRISQEERAVLRDRLEEKFSKEVRVERQRIEQQARSMGATGNIGLGLTTGLTSAGNRMTFGAIPRLVGMVSPSEQRRFEVAQAARREASPWSATAGDVAGFFAPGPLRALTGTAGRLAASPLVRVAAKDRLAQSVLSRTLIQTGANLTGGTAAIGAATLTDFTTDATLENRIQAITDSLNPSTLSGVINWGFAVTTGVPQGAIRQKVNQAARTAIERAKRVAPRLKISPDIARPESSLGLWFSNIANLPGGRGIAQKFLRQGIFEPISDALTRMERSVASSAPVAKVGHSLRNIWRTEESAMGQSGAISAHRKGLQSRALQQEGSLRIGQETQRVLMHAIRDAKKVISYQDRARLTGTVSSAITRLGKVVGKAKKKGTSITVQDLEDFRAGLAYAVKLGRRNPELISDVDQRVLGASFRAINETARQTAPKYYDAQQAARFLHSIRTLAPNAKIHDPEEVILAHFSGNDVVSRWKVIENYAPQEVTQALRGWYLANWIQKVTPKDAGTRLINMPTMLNAFRSKKDMFRKSVFDAVLPGMREEFQALGEISYRVQQGIGRTEGAQTGARLATQAMIRSLVVGAAVLGYTMMGDPALSERARPILGAAGAAVAGSILVNRGLHSAMGGSIGTQLNRAALGQPLYGPTSAAAALQTAIGNTGDKR